MYPYGLFVIVCDAGFYGAKCQQECSKFCNNERDCYPASGYCKEGCKRGWEGPKCLVGKAYAMHFISEIVYKSHRHCTFQPFDLHFLCLL